MNLFLTAPNRPRALLLLAAMALGLGLPVACGGAALEAQADAEPMSETQQAATQPASCATNSASWPAPFSCSIPHCEEQTCWGKPFAWQDGKIPVEIILSIPGQCGLRGQPSCLDAQDRDNILAGMQQWNEKTSNVIFFEQCSGNDCSAAGKTRWLRISFGGPNGIVGTPPSEGPNVMNLPHDASPFTIAHELGHAIGLPHEFQRNDRDRYLKLDPAYFCTQSQVAGTTRCKSFPSLDPRFPPIPSGDFGVFDPESCMSYWQADNGTALADICTSAGTMPDSLLGVRDRDGSNAIELYRMTFARWSPYLSLGTDIGSNKPLSNELAPGVTPQGAPALVAWPYPSLGVFVTGSNKRVYYKWKNVENETFEGWSSWYDLSGGASFDALGEPSATITSSEPATTRVAVRGRIGTQSPGIFVRSYSGAGWAAWENLGAPSAGAASDPAMVAIGGSVVAVFVRGGDGRLYQRLQQGSGWGGWTLSNPWWSFRGKPSVVAMSGYRVAVFTRGPNDDHVWMVTSPDLRTTSPWSNPVAVPGGTLTPGSSPAAASFFDPDTSTAKIAIFIRGGDNRLWMSTYSGTSFSAGYTPLGGILTSNPSVANTLTAAPRLDVANLGADGNVFWRGWPYQQPDTIYSPYPQCN